MLAERVDQWGEKWKQEGRQEGRQEGEGRLLSRQLLQRFGSLPDWARERITAATPEQLEVWGERIFDAATLELFSTLTEAHADQGHSPESQVAFEL